MKKYELHLDALIAMFIVFAIAMAFLLFQRYQYSVVVQENVDLLWENSDLEANLVLRTAQFDNCQSLVASMKEPENISGVVLFPQED